MDKTQLEEFLLQRQRAMYRQPNLSRLGDRIGAAIKYAENFDWENEEPDLLAKVGLLYKKRVEDIRKNIPERRNDSLVEMQNLFVAPEDEKEASLKAQSIIQKAFSNSRFPVDLLDAALMEKDPIVQALMKPKETVEKGVDSLKEALINYFGNK